VEVVIGQVVVEYDRVIRSREWKGEAAALAKVVDKYRRVWCAGSLFITIHTGLNRI
jgi:hypothetical protein